MVELSTIQVLEDLDRDLRWIEGMVPGNLEINPGDCANQNCHIIDIASSPTVYMYSRMNDGCIGWFLQGRSTRERIKCMFFLSQDFQSQISHITCSLPNHFHFPFVKKAFMFQCAFECSSIFAFWQQRELCKSHKRLISQTSGNTFYSFLCPGFWFLWNLVCCLMINSNLLNMKILAWRFSQPLIRAIGESNGYSPLMQSSKLADHFL